MRGRSQYKGLGGSFEDQLICVGFPDALDAQKSRPLQQRVNEFPIRLALLEHPSLTRNAASGCVIERIPAVNKRMGSTSTCPAYRLLRTPPRSVDQSCPQRRAGDVISRKRERVDRFFGYSRATYKQKHQSPSQGSIPKPATYERHDPYV